MKSAGSRLSAEVFVIPFGDASIVYAPLRQAAFVANGAFLNALAAPSSRLPKTPMGDEKECARPLTSVHARPASIHRAPSLHHQ